MFVAVLLLLLLLLLFLLLFLLLLFSIYISDSKNAQFGQQHSAKAVTDCISDIEIRVTEI